MRTWSRRRTVATVGGAAVFVWLLLVAWSLWSARSEVQAGSDGLQEVRNQADLAALVDPETGEQLGTALDHFDAAEARLSSPALFPLRVLPVAGRHLRAAEGLVDSAQDGTIVAQDTLAALVELTDQPNADGAERLATLAELSDVAAEAEQGLAAVDPGSSKALVGPLADAVDTMTTQRDEASEAAEQLGEVATAVATLLAGPDSYLLLGANNAEMRNGSGMFLTAAPIRFEGGMIELGDVRPTAELVLPEGAVPASGDLAANWPWLEPGRDLRNLGLTADFPQSAALAIENWAQVPGGGDAAGVIVVDVDAIRSLLRVVGPVELDGVTYDADNVRGELLREQYRRFDDDQTGRRDQLGDVARVIFDRIDQGEWKLEDLATEMADAVQGRHLLVWSADPEIQAAWEAVGADGHLEPNSVSVGLLNRGATKIDSWVDASADIVTKPGDADRSSITVTYTIDNTAPDAGPVYLVGPNVEGLQTGDHVGLAVVNLPAGTTDVSMEGAEVFLQGGDGETVVVGGEVTIPQGESVTVMVTGLLPEGLDQLTLEPTARVPRTKWSVNGRTYDRDRRRTVDLAT